MGASVGPRHRASGACVPCTTKGRRDGKRAYPPTRHAPPVRALVELVMLVVPVLFPHSGH
eukprot:scaffold1382_cov429-Prasinococcus_capsulatus_cf.AAC.5